MTTPIEQDLFAAIGDRTNDPRYQIPEVPVQDGPKMLMSAERMRDIFCDVVGQQFPTKSEIHKYETEGLHTQNKQTVKGHRFEIEHGSIPIAGWVGQISESQWAYSVCMLISSSNLSTFLNGLKGRQRNGDWVPTLVQCRPGRETTLNGRKPAKMNLPEGDVAKVSWLGDEPMEVFPVGVEMMDYAIKWTDRNNGPDMPALNAKGEPIYGAPTVQISNTTDPAMLALLEKLASKSEGGGMDPAVLSILDKLADGNQELAGALKQIADGNAGTAEAIKAMADKPAPTISIERAKLGRPPGSGRKPGDR